MSRPSPEVSWALDRLLGPVTGDKKRQIAAPPRITTASAARARRRLPACGRPATAGTSRTPVVTAARNRYPTVGIVSMYRGSLGSSSRALRTWATARVRALSVTVTSGQTAWKISSLDTARSRFSIRNCSKRNDFGSSVRFSPFAVSRRFNGSKTNWSKRYRPFGNPIMISSPAFGNKSDPDHDFDGPQAAWWPHVNTNGFRLTHDNPCGAALQRSLFPAFRTLRQAPHDDGAPGGRRGLPQRPGTPPVSPRYRRSEQPS